VAEGIGAHLGREVVERLVDPLLGGISAASCDALSLRSASPELFEAAGAPRLMAALRSRQTAATRGQIGVTEERPVFLTPRGGVHRIVERLARELAEAVQVDSPVRSVARAAGVWRVSTPHRSFSARQLVFATPAYVSAPLLADVDADLSGELASIRTSSVALVLLAYPSESVTLPPGSGLLVPRPEGRLLTAASWWSQKWPHLEVPGHVVIRASAGRDRDTRFTSLADDELVAALHTDLADMLGLSATPAGSHVARWMRGFPQYDVGHAARVARLEAHASRVGVSLVGASYRGIGLPACIRDAKRTAAALCA
jgi:oxygen-dependent protoporphyrinogen oxidase